MAVCFVTTVSVCDRCTAAMKSRQSAELTADEADPLAEALIVVATLVGP